MLGSQGIVVRCTAAMFFSTVDSHVPIHGLLEKITRLLKTPHLNQETVQSYPFYLNEFKNKKKMNHSDKHFCMCLGPVKEVGYST